MPRAERAEVVRSGSSMYGSSTGVCTGAEPDVPASGIAAAAELKTRCANFGVAANEVERVASSLQLPTNLPQLRASISRAVVRDADRIRSFLTIVRKKTRIVAMRVEV